MRKKVIEIDFTEQIKQLEADKKAGYPPNCNEGYVEKDGKCVPVEKDEAKHKKKGYAEKADPKKKKGATREWFDAIIFAVIAATVIRMFFIEAFTIPTPSMEKSLLVGDFLFVSKISYGARIPNTPLSFPFAHHTLPLTDSTKSYLEWVRLPYHRIPGLAKIKNNDYR